eukprot:2822909-Rhodomonas_salina.1
MTVHTLTQTDASDAHRVHTRARERTDSVLRGARVQPLLANAAQQHGAAGVNVVSCESDADLSIDAGGRAQSFNFDAVFAHDASQEEVFSEVQPLVVSALDGYNVCIFAYGQTGSGKTYTMQGPASNPGVNPRALGELFKVAEERADQATYDIRCELRVEKRACCVWGVWGGCGGCER